MKRRRKFLYVPNLEERISWGFKPPRKLNLVETKKTLDQLRESCNAKNEPGKYGLCV